MDNFKTKITNKRFFELFFLLILTNLSKLIPKIELIKLFLEYEKNYKHEKYNFSRFISA